MNAPAPLSVSVPKCDTAAVDAGQGQRVAVGFGVVREHVEGDSRLVVVRLGNCVRNGYRRTIRVETVIVKVVAALERSSPPGPVPRSRTVTCAEPSCSQRAGT